MAKFLTTTGVSYELERIINSASEKLILVSPYLKLNDRVKTLLEDKDRMKLDVRVVYGKSELQPEEMAWLQSKTSIRTSFCKNLHAKCYLNESSALITSMNLYEYSQVNNNEIGVLISRDEDLSLYKEVYEEIMRLIRSSDELRVTVEKVDDVHVTKGGTKSKPTSGAKESIPDKGYCIRCEKEIKPNSEMPYCRDCYASWVKYKNPQYEERHCHTCGKPNKSTIIKPVCYDCFKKFMK
jgi:hypothetical protein